MEMNRNDKDWTLVNDDGSFEVCYAIAISPLLSKSVTFLIRRLSGVVKFVYNYTCKTFCT